VAFLSKKPYKKSGGKGSAMLLIIREKGVIKRLNAARRVQVFSQD